MNPLIQKLKLMENVYIQDYNLLREIVTQYIVTGKATINVVRENKVYEWKENDYSDFDTWCTFNGCQNEVFSLIDGLLNCEITIFNGDMCYGQKESLRFVVDVKLPLDFIENIKSNIDYAFLDYAEAKYDEHLQSVKDKWISKFMKDSIKD